MEYVLASKHVNPMIHTLTAQTLCKKASSDNSHTACSQVVSAGKSADLVEAAADPRFSRCYGAFSVHGHYIVGLYIDYGDEEMVRVQRFSRL